MARSLTLSQEIRKIHRTHQGEDGRRRGAVRWLVLVAVYLLTVFLTSPFYFFRPAVGKLGEVPPGQVNAQVDFRFTTRQNTEEWERERQERHKRLFIHDATRRDQVIRSLNELHSTADAIDPSAQTPEEILAAIRRVDSRLTFLAADNIADFVSILRDAGFRQSIGAILLNAYDENVIVAPRDYTRYKGYIEYGLAEVHDTERNNITREEIVRSPIPLPSDWAAWAPLMRPLGQAFVGSDREAMARTVARQLLTAIVQPNLRLDTIGTEESLRSYPERDLSTPYARGAAILPAEALRRPTGLTAEEVQLLATHRGAVEARHSLRLVGHAGFTLIVFLIIAFYVRKFSRELEFSARNLILISIPVLLGLALEAAIIVLAGGDVSKVGYLFPAGAIGMLGVLLLDVRMALLLVTWGCLLFGLQVNLNYEFVIVGLFGGYTGVAAIYTIRKRWEVFVAAILIGLVCAAIILITSYIRNPEIIPLGLAGLGFFAGIQGFLVLAIMPIFERFGIVTDMQLLELTGLHHPLIRQVEELAPGTWQHTLNVTKLAEAAATEIGVNYLLVRAGCYFHDIGKTKRPEYFTENQITNEDKMLHADKRPQISTLIIKNHVKEGAEMARAAGLPQRIIDFIEQHHGTSLIYYFYDKAQKGQARGEIKEPVREEDYRYPGPKPQTIEAGIVMLADTVEATATAKLSSRAVREEDIQKVVRDTITEKFNDGQFDECNLTLRDLNVIREVFVRVLKSRFHTRIDYPKKVGAAGRALPAAERRSRESREKVPMREDRSAEGITPIPSTAAIPEMIPPSGGDPAPRK